MGCARCGHDLRGLTHPKCPQCALEFDWADAVPIEELTCLHCDYHLYGLVETRCPECGQPFNWEKVLDSYRRRKKPLFEYRWRQTPARSLVRTLIWALRPGRLWSMMDIHDPPRVLPVLGMVAIALLFFAASMAVLEGLQDWLWQVRAWAYRTRYWRWERVAIVLGWFPQRIGDAAADAYLRNVFVSTVVWASASFGSLMIFRQSMRRCRVRTVHIVRVWSYAIFLIVPVACVVSYIPPLINALIGRSYFPNIAPPIALLVLCHVTYSLDRAYKTYLRMRYSVAVAIASQLVAALAALTLCVAVISSSFRGPFIFDILEFLRLL
ncbi:MAG: hypothetical protein ACYTFA_18460 [Planctomycetota bacterium]